MQRPADDAPAVLPCVQEQSDGVRAVRQEGDPRARARALEIKILAGGGNEDREARVDLVAAVGGELQILLSFGVFGMISKEIPLSGAKLTL